MDTFKRFKLTTYEQYTFGVLAVCLVTGGSFLFYDYMGYKTVSLLLLFTVSVCAMFFDILPVLVVAVLSAVLWDYLFIPPRFTLVVGSAEDMLMLLMYFVIALVNAVFTFKIRQIEKVSRQKDEKAQMLKLYNALLNSLSHELRTPISTILAVTDNLQSNGDKLTEGDKKQLLEEASQASLRLNRQVENLLNMSRLESDVIKPKKDWCDVNELIYSAINSLEDNLQNHKADVKISKGVPLVKLDFGLMEQVLYNLIYNATLYTPAGTHIKIFADCIEDVLILTVEDNGNGFPPEEVNKVFDKFYRVEHTKAGGTGLGLSIVKGFIEAHGGTISVANKVPHGARFTIEIPVETSYLNNLKNE